LQSDNSAASLFRHLFSCFSRSFAAVSVTTHGNLPSCPAFPSDGSDLGFASAGSDLQSDPIILGICNPIFLWTKSDSPRFACHHSRQTTIVLLLQKLDPFYLQPANPKTGQPLTSYILRLTNAAPCNSKKASARVVELVETLRPLKGLDPKRPKMIQSSLRSRNFYFFDKLCGKKTSL
jgi:hypothetical protein